MVVKQKILIVDDSEMNRSILTDILEDEYEIIEACNGYQAVNILRSNGVEISLVLLDVVMPGMDGFGVLGMMNSYKWIQDIPVIMISAENSSSYMEKAYDLGAVDYIQRPFDALVVRRRVINTIMLYAKQKKLVGLVEDQIYEKEKDQSLMVNVLSHIVEFRNGESGLHVLHIHAITEYLLQALLRRTDKYRLSQQQIALIVTASALHDVGKICIDDKILNKPGRYTASEFEIMKTHAALGAKLLEDLPQYRSEPLLKIAGEICRWHHERYDGKGYPDGLAGDDIPISAQVVALADVYDALTSERVYKKAIRHEAAIEMILAGECGAFNPLLLDIIRNDADNIREEVRTSFSSMNVRKYVKKMSRDVMSKNELSVSQRTIDLLEREREKYRFLVSESREILFEVYFDPQSIEFMEDGGRRLGVDTLVTEPVSDEKLLSCMGKECVESLFEKIKTSTPSAAPVELECVLRLDGKLTKCRITAKALFSADPETGESVCDGAIGKIESTENGGKL